MCRWIAYRGETTALEHYVTEPDHSLISQSIHALESTASINGDGFGLGWYGQHPEPGLYREIRPAWSDENLRYLCRHLQSHLFFAHVRAATGTAITRANCHPFACGKWLFMHNGFLGNWSRWRRQVESLIPDELYPSRIGTTDSEAIFLAILGAGLDQPVAAAKKTLATLRPPPTWSMTSPPRSPTGATFMRFATRSTITPTRFTTESPRAASSSSRSRSITTTIGSRCPKITSSWRGPASAPACCRSSTAPSRRRNNLQGCQFFCHAGGVLASIRIKAIRHGLAPLFTQA